MKLVYFLFASILLFVIGCSESFQITKKSAGYNNDQTIYTSSKIKIKGNSSRDFETTYLQFDCTKTDSGRIYSFVLEHIGPQWLNIQSLKLDIDGMETEHDYDRPPIVDARDVRGINETVKFILNKNKLIDIIEIRECEIIIVGETRNVEIDLRKDWIAKLEQFYDETQK